MITTMTTLNFDNRSELIKFHTNVSKRWVSEGFEVREIEDKLAA